MIYFEQTCASRVCSYQSTNVQHHLQQLVDKRTPWQGEEGRDISFGEDCRADNITNSSSE